VSCFSQSVSNTQIVGLLGALLLPLATCQWILSCDDCLVAHPLSLRWHKPCLVSELFVLWGALCEFPSGLSISARCTFIERMWSVCVALYLPENTDRLVSQSEVRVAKTYPWYAIDQHLTVLCTPQTSCTCLRWITRHQKWLSHRFVVLCFLFYRFYVLLCSRIWLSDRDYWVEAKWQLTVWPWITISRK